VRDESRHLRGQLERNDGAMDVLVHGRHGVPLWILQNRFSVDAVLFRFTSFRPRLTEIGIPFDESAIRSTDSGSRPEESQCPLDE
jgi:hypothetical protein